MFRGPLTKRHNKDENGEIFKLIDEERKTGNNGDIKSSFKAKSFAQSREQFIDSVKMFPGTKKVTIRLDRVDESEETKNNDA